MSFARSPLPSGAGTAGSGAEATADSDTDAAAAAGLLGPDDPPVVEPVNPSGRAPVLVIADHAGNAVPAALDGLGLGATALERHVAYDIGAAWMARRLAERLDAPGLIHRYSRLIIDPNRGTDDPTSVCAISDGIVVPGNRGLSADDARRRAAVFHAPYHDAIEAAIAGFRRRGVVPAIVSVHSFTPALRTHIPRPWHIGVLWGEDGRIALPLMAGLAADGTVMVGDNEPYDARNSHGYTIERHALPPGLPNVLLETRQDLIATRPDAEAWADRVADALAPILSDETLYRPFREA